MICLSSTLFWMMMPAMGVHRRLLDAWRDRDDLRGDERGVALACSSSTCLCSLETAAARAAAAAATDLAMAKWARATFERRSARAWLAACLCRAGRGASRSPGPLMTGGSRSARFSTTFDHHCSMTRRRR
jgi:hypothetical protein